jgi:uncharacterized protein YggT (Ycf19 family)
MNAVVVLATARDQVADYVSALVWVYSLLIFAYVVTLLYFNAFGGRIPYARWSSAVLGFLRDVSEPYLGVFRRVIPPIGPIDVSPMVALIVLTVAGRVVVALIRG